MNLKSISVNVGKALMVNALFLLLSVVVSLLYGRDEAFVPLLISFLITLTIGAFPLIFVRKVQENTLAEGYVIIVLSWLMSFICGMLPYLLYGGEFTIINALFESVSGYTTTGSTILTDIEALPASLLFWRSSTHFLGGLGVVVFLLLVLPDRSQTRFRLSSLEISSMSRNGYMYRLGTVVRVMMAVYIGLVVVETFLLWLAGMSLFDAVNHSFSTVATGGFSTKNTSIMYYDSLAIDLIVIVFMILSSIHFGVIYTSLRKRSLKPVSSSVTGYYLSVIAVLSVIVALVLLVDGGYESPGKALVDSLFQVSSFISTTGFGNADNALWPFLANFFLLYAGFHCGCSGSTTGGMKADRMLVLVKSSFNELARKLHPASFVRTKVGDSVVHDDVISSVLLYFITYVFVLLISFIILLMDGMEVTDAFSGTLSSLGNVGPGIGSLGTMGNYASLSPLAKSVLCIDMFLGRLEIYPVLVAVHLMLTGRKRK